MTGWLERCGYFLGCWLSCPRPWHQMTAPYDEDVRGCLMPGDVLLVEGSSRVSTVIKYLTQSSWSHAALYVGERQARRLGAHPGQVFAEAFQSVHYPILSIRVAGHRRLFRRRHYTLFTPRDFDISPFFGIVKPRLVGGFSPRELRWLEDAPALGVPARVAPES